MMMIGPNFVLILLVGCCRFGKSSPIFSVPGPAEILKSMTSESTRNRELGGLAAAAAAGPGAAAPANLENFPTPFNLKITAEVNTKNGRHLHLAKIDDNSQPPPQPQLMPDNNNNNNNSNETTTTNNNNNGSHENSSKTTTNNPTNRLIRKLGYLITLLGMCLSWVGFYIVTFSTYIAGLGVWIEEFGVLIVGLGNWLALLTFPALTSSSTTATGNFSSEK